MRKPRPKTPWSSIDFPYAVRRDRAGQTYYPVVEAGIQTPRGVYPARLLLDSGADCTMLPKFFGELIGLDFGRLPALTVTGIEGRGMKAFKGPLCLQIAGLSRDNSLKPQMDTDGHRWT